MEPGLFSQPLLIYARFRSSPNSLKRGLAVFGKLLSPSVRDGSSKIIQRPVCPGAGDVTVLTHIRANDRLSILVVLERSAETKTGHHVVGLLGAKCAPNLRPLGPQILDIPKHVRVFEVLKNPSKQLVHPPLTLVRAAWPLTYEQAVRPKPENTTPWGR